MFHKSLSIALVLVLAIWQSTAFTSVLNELIFSGCYDFIDLSHPFDNKTVYWPTMINFTTLNPIGTVQPDGSWFAQADMCAGEHGGTHIDAPYHFDQNGLYAGDIPLDKLIVPLIVIDVSGKVNGNPDFVLSKKDLNVKHIEFILSNKQRSFLIIFKFGWTKYYHDRIDYFGLDFETNTMSFPGLGVEVAQWLTAQKNVVGVAVDVASSDPGSSTTYDVHKTLLPAGLYVIENVKLLENQQLPTSTCTGLVLPMKIAKGTGAPLRLVAICPKKPWC